MTLSSDLSAMITAAMADEGLSLRHMSDRIGRSHNYVGLRLRGQAKWALDDIYAIAKALRLTPRAVLAALQDPIN